MSNDSHGVVRVKFLNIKVTSANLRY